MKKIIGYSVGIFLVLLCIVGVAFYVNKKEYIVSFNTNGGNIIASKKVNQHEKIKKPKDPIKDGYIFIGWYLDNEEFDFNKTIDKNITLTAYFEPINTNSVTLLFDTLSLSKISAIKIDEGTILKEVPNPQKDGYTFEGWYYHNKLFDFKNPITEDMILVAHYKRIDRNTIKVIFDASNEEELLEVEIEKGSMVKMPKEPIRDGYIFMGWYLDNEEFDFTKPIYDDITLTAHWEIL